MNEQFEYFEKYAGFWKRFVAYIIDEIILGLARTILFVPLILLSSFSLAPFFKNSYDKNFVNVVSLETLSGSDMAVGMMVFVFIFIGFILSTIIGWLYYAIMESSNKQATFGKVVMSIRVTDLDGNKISFGKASARYFAKILSTLFFYIGYIMAAFTEKKQALHDMLVGCLVVNTTADILREMDLQKDSNSM